MTEYLLLEATYLVRIILAGVCGAFVGYERKNRGKGAGIRTHMVVALASALMMIVSKYGFTDTANADPSRVASTIVTGVGFLGAGMIYVQNRNILGLTTAAGVWATAGIGMAIGAGMYVIGILSSVIIVLAQIVLHKNLPIMHMPVEENLKFIIENRLETVEEIKGILSEYDVKIEKIKCKKISNDMLELEMYVFISGNFQPQILLDLICKKQFIQMASI